MANTRIGVVVRDLRRLADTDSSADATDSELLERFSRRHEEAAFDALLRRHGPMVLGLCRRLLGNPHDADDVFQATFILLARKAGAIRKYESLASWLHGVAYRLAGKLRVQNARRLARERHVATMRTPQPTVEAVWHELQELLDGTLARLPARYRAPLVLCYLEGKTHEEAARQLGCPLATLRSRVARGRELLRRRLTCRGLTLSAVPFATLLAMRPADAAVPATLLNGVCAAAVQFAAGKPTTGLISESVAALVKGGMRTVRVRLLSALLLSVGLAVAGAGLIARQAEATDPPPEPPAGSAPGQAAKAVAKGPGGLDRYADPLPAEALVRFGTVRFRHGGSVHSVAFTPDGKVLASCAADSAENRVRLSDPVTGKILRELPARDEDSLSCMGLTADGKTVVAGGSSWNENGERVGVIYVWNLATGKEVRRLQGQWPEEWIECLAISPDERTLATGSEEFFKRDKPQVIRLWDLEAGKAVCELKGHDGPIGALVFTRDGKTVISSSSSRWKTVKDHTIRVWDVATGQELRRLEGHGASVRTLALSPDGKTLASGSWDGTVRLWDLAAGKEIGRLPRHSGGVYSLAFAPDGKQLVSASGYDDLDVRLWDLSTGRVRCTLPKPPRPVEGFAFAPDGKLLATAGGEGHTIRLWDPASGTEITPQGGHEAEVSRVFFRPDGRVLTWSGDDCTLREWDPATGQERRRFRVPRWVFCATLSPDGRVLAYARRDKIIRLCDWASGKELARCQGHTDYLRGLAFSPDGKRLASGGDDKTVRLWDVATGKELRRFTHKDYFYALAFSPDGKALAWAGINSCLRVCDVATGEERFQNDRVGEAIDGIAISPDGKLLAKGRPGFVELWDLTSGRQVGSLSGRKPRESISIANRCSLAFSRDGKTLAVAGWDDHIRLYELATGHERHRLIGHPGRVTCVAFSPDRRSLVTGSADTTALLWDLTGRSPATAIVTLTGQKLDSLWSALADPDSEQAYQAMQILMAAPSQSIPYLKGRIRPVPVPDRERVAQLLTDLDSDQFTVRQKAADELTDLGEGAESALRQKLDGKPSLETRRRLQQLLDRIGGSSRLRQSRAIELLERQGGREARALLEALAHGLPEARLTGEARAALKRVARDSSEP
jgi:RNA polymerase sigma factor (sigma-70 family)